MNRELPHRSLPLPDSRPSTPEYNQRTVETEAAEVIDAFQKHGNVRLSGSDSAILLERTVRQAFSDTVSQAAVGNQGKWFKQGAVDIIARGELWGEHIPEVSFSADYPVDIRPLLQRRLILSVYGRNPILAEQFISKEVIGAHFSSAASLLPTMENGLKSIEQQRRDKDSSTVIATGERFMAGEGLRNAVSFVAMGPEDWAAASDRYLKGDDNSDIDTLFDRAQTLRRAAKAMHPDDRRRSEVYKTAYEELDLANFLEAAPPDERTRVYQELIKENFPVAYFVNGRAVRDSREFPSDSFMPREEKAFRVRSDIGGGAEFAVKDGVGQEDIPVIAVPASRIELTARLAKSLGWDNTLVVALEDIPALAPAAERWEDRNRYRTTAITAYPGSIFLPLTR